MESCDTPVTLQQGAGFIIVVHNQKISSMKKFHPLFACFFTAALSYAQPSFQWVKAFSGTATDEGSAIATDASDNVYITGSFEGVTDFDPGPGTYTLNSNNVNFSDIFIAKLDASGNLLWAGSMGVPNSDDKGESIAVDAAGNVYITGNFSGTVDFDPGPSTYTLAAAGAGSDIFVLKLNTSGNLVWARNMGGTSSEYSYGIAVDASANVYTTGFFNATSDFDPGPATYTIASKGSLDVFVSKLDAGGNFVWAKNLGGTSSEVGYSIAVDGSSNVYTTGNFKGSCDFDPSAATYTIASGGGDDIFVSKLDAGGNFVWAKSMKSSSGTNNSGRCVRADASGNVYTSGFYNGTTDFDPGPATYTLNSGGVSNGFVSKLDASGNFSWVGELRGTSAVVMSIALDASGNVYGTGSFDGSVDFDPTATTYSLSSVTNSEDIYLFKWSSAGAFVWAQDIASATLAGSTNRSSGVTMNPSSGNIYTTGFYNYTTDFDPGPGTNSLSSVADSWDVFIHKTGQAGFCTAPAAPVNTTPAANQVLCSGNSTTLTATSSGTLSWYATPTSTTALATGTAYTTTALAAGQYTYYAEAATCTVSAVRTSITLTVNALPVIAVNSGSICSGSSFTIIPTGASTYTISGGSAIVSPATTSSYSISGTSTAGCLSSNSAISTITVNALPTLSVNSGSICSGSSFTIMPAGASTYTISGGSAIVSPTATTSYSINGTSAAGCISSGSAISTITVNVLPTLSVNSGSICSGSSFTIIPTGASTYTISGGSALVSPTTTTSYSIIGTSAAGCLSQTQAVSTITVYSLPSITITATSSLICAGEAAKLTASGTNTYTWSTGATTASISVNPAITTSYTVTGRNTASGCSNVATATQSVSACTSLMETEASLFQVYPNPNEGSFSIHYSGRLEDVRIEITDASGRIVYNSSFEKQSEVLSVSLSDYAKGLYFLKLNYNGKQEVKKLIIE